MPTEQERDNPELMGAKPTMNSRDAAKLAYRAYHAGLGTQAMIDFEDLPTTDQSAWALVAGAVVSYYDATRPYPEDRYHYTCPKCGRVSYNPNDVLHQYCGHCHTFSDDQPVQPLKPTP